MFANDSSEVIDATRVMPLRMSTATGTRIENGVDQRTRLSSYFTKCGLRLEPQTTTNAVKCCENDLRIVLCKSYYNLQKDASLRSCLFATREFTDRMAPRLLVSEHELPPWTPRMQDRSNVAGHSPNCSRRHRRRCRLSNRY